MVISSPSSLRLTYKFSAILSSLSVNYLGNKKAPEIGGKFGLSLNTFLGLAQSKKKAIYIFK